MVFNQFFSDALVRFAGTEQNAVRYDAGAAATGFQHPQKERKEQKLRLFGVGDGFQVVVDLSASTVPLNGGFARQTVYLLQMEFCFDTLSL